MTHLLIPALWLIVFIVGLPQLSETVYSPALPEIAHALQASDNLVEFTLTIYLFGFALGTLFWGKLSDHIGRKPCVIAGLLIFIIGSLGCYLSSSIELLLFSRFIQAFGGSIGSVLGQAICRDAFHGPALGKAYSTVGSSLSLFPAIGPMIGGVIAQHFGWASIFIFLILFAVILSIAVVFKLPETHLEENRNPVSLLNVFCNLIKDRNVLIFAFIVAACNGISFSFFAEGSFYLIDLLGLTPSQYGICFVGIALFTLAGGALSKKLHQSMSSQDIMQIGLKIVLISTLLFFLITSMHLGLFKLSDLALIVITLISQMLTMFGVCMITSNALALSLVNYKWCIGTASSIFGFGYYTLISLFTMGMSILHDGTLLPMPLYFFSIALAMFLVSKKIN